MECAWVRANLRVSLVRLRHWSAGLNMERTYEQCGIQFLCALWFQFISHRHQTRISCISYMFWSSHLVYGTERCQWLPLLCSSVHHDRNLAVQTEFIFSPLRRRQLRRCRPRNTHERKRWWWQMNSLFCMPDKLIPAFRTTSHVVSFVHRTNRQAADVEQNEK